MRIKELQVSGFKSFMDKTPLHFNVPITGIVGPNGCGKSNVVDAIKWVTGELSYKQLRGKSSEDLIFAGSDRRPPSSMMEVSLTLDNHAQLAPAQYNQYSEITVLRRIYRDGSSEFYINKVPCRLRDITDLFLDTGIGQSSYSIIEQGKVGTIVSGRPEDRRLMIEEAAGITKYKHRKKAALRKMDATKQNLLRVSDIVKELEKQIASLERQAKKAEKYHLAKEEFEKVDVGLCAYEYQRFQSQKTDLLKDDETKQDQLEETQAKLSSLEAELETEKTSLDELDASFQNSQQELFSKKSSIQSTEYEIQQCNAVIENANRQSILDAEKIDQLTLEKEQMQQRVAQIAQELEGSTAKKQALSDDLEQKKDLFQKSKGELTVLEESLEQSKKDHITWVTHKTESLSKVDAIKNNIRSIEQEMFEAKEDLATIADEILQTQNQVEAQSKTFEEIKQLYFGFQENQNVLEDQLADTEKQKIEIESQLQEVQKELSLKESRLQALTEFTKSYQGYTKTVQNIMNKHHQESAFAGVKGVLGEFIHIETGYEKCVQAVLADEIESIVVDEVTSTKDFVKYLKEDQQSRAIFLTPQMQRVVGEKISDSLIVGTLDQWVTVQDSLSLGIEEKLAQTYVVQTLTDALNLRSKYGQINVVSLDGDYIQASGTCHVGPFNDVRGDLEVRQEIEKIESLLEPLQVQKRELTQQKTTLEQQFTKVRDHLSQVAQNIKRENQKSSEIEMKLQKLIDAKGYLTKRQQEREQQIENYKTKLQDSDHELQSLQQSLEDVVGKIETVEQEIETKSTSYQDNKRSFETYQQDIHQYELELSKIFERVDSLQREKTHLDSAISNATDQIQRLELEKEQHLENIERQKNKIEQYKETLSAELANFQNQEKVNSDLRIQHDQMHERLRSLEAQVREVRQQKETQLEKVNELRMVLSQIGLKMENLQEQVWETYERNIVDVLSELTDEEKTITEENFDQVKQNRDELKTKLSKFGNVNLAAIDEIGELKERHEFLSTQQIDLETSLATLTDAIKTINKTTKEMFEVTYEEVNTRFQKIFPRLFKGGKARLILSDPENILESGVDIFAQPPGKKLQNMNLLSGGEKALTAIALLFAIFEYKAPPFCVLDEVDAPLDDANVLRYVSIVKEMSQNTQFIVITHNKSSMQMAQNLYGVTMEEPGVSRTVSVRLQQENIESEEAFFEAKSVA